MCLPAIFFYHIKIDAIFRGNEFQISNFKLFQKEKNSFPSCLQSKNLILIPANEKKTNRGKLKFFSRQS